MPWRRGAFTVTMGLGADNVVRNLRVGNGVVEKLSDIASLSCWCFDENGTISLQRQVCWRRGVGAKPDEDFCRRKRTRYEASEEVHGYTSKSNKRHRVICSQLY